jgi:gamma-glutamylcyclotransferase (GGCT)/AIG2-like uncharacterized protein YtfP
VQHSLDSAESTPFLFVYGTLMKGSAEDWQEKVAAELVGRGSINAKLYDLGDYPGAIPVDGSNRQHVRGELYRLSNPELATSILDEYEEVLPSQPDEGLFVRALVTVTLDDGRKENAWAYFYNRAVDEAPLIPSGDYREKALLREK